MQNRRNDFNRKIREVIALHRQDGTVENFQYKTILIDEFQDFAYDEKNDSASWIRLIQDCFLKEEGELVVFSDASQNVRGTPLDKTGSPYTPGFSGRWNTLATNFRFSTVTSMVTKAFQSAFMPANSQDVPSPSKKESPLGGFGFADPSLSNRKYNDSFFVDCLLWFSAKYQININDICVMAAETKILRSLDAEIEKRHCFSVSRTFETKEERSFAEAYVRAKHENINKEKPSYAFDPKNPTFKKLIDQEASVYNRHQKTLFKINHPHMNALKLSTIHSFKGQESNTVILLLTNALMESAHSASLIYTALSRAKQNLVVFDATDASPANPWYPTYEQYKHFFKEMDTYFKNT